MQPGETGDVLVSLRCVVAQFRNGQAGLGRCDLGAWAHQPGAGGDGKVPVDHGGVHQFTVRPAASR